jgi:predicted phage terminase large subunit-like protein
LPRQRPETWLGETLSANTAEAEALDAAAGRIPGTKDLRDFSRTMGYQNKNFHEEWLHHYQSGRSFILLAPRGHAKSTTGQEYLLWRIARNPNIRIIIISSTYELAKGLAFSLKLELETKFPWLVKGAAKWGEKGMFVSRSEISKDPTIRIASMEGVEPGPRADLIWGDDVVGENNSASELQRQKIHTIFNKVLMPMLEPNGQTFLTGTPYHFGDLYSQLEKEDSWQVYRYTAIQKDDSALWPERFPILCSRSEHSGNCCLTFIRRQLGTPIFNNQYLCDPSGLVGRLLKLGWLEPYYDPPLPGDLVVVQGIDLAVSEKETADYTAIATIGYSPSLQKIWVMDIWRGQVDFPTQLRMIRQKAVDYRPSAIVIETNVYQKVLATQLQASTMLPIMGIVTVKDKIQRILGNLSPHFESKKLLVRRDMHEFISEYLEFPDSAHDDMLDALEFAVNYVANSAWNKMAIYSGSGATFGRPKGAISLLRKDKDRFLGGPDWWLGREAPKLRKTGSQK